jgi:uncharacterized protein YecT (DUF1311 family)
MSKKFGAGVFALLLSLFGAGAARGQEATKTGTPHAKQDAPKTTAEEQDDADREDPCPGSHTQFELNQCAARARDKADAELNQVYRELMKDTSGAERAKLRDAQLAWLKFRDAHCDYESIGNKGGSIYPMVASFCLAKVTRGRVEQLREIIAENSER